VTDVKQLVERRRWPITSYWCWHMKPGVYWKWFSIKKT